MKCFKSFAIEDYFSNRLNPEDVAALEKHIIEECHSCFLRVMAHDPTKNSDPDFDKAFDEYTEKKILPYALSLTPIT